MGQVIEIFSRQELEENSNGEPDSSECQIIEYDPEKIVSFFGWTEFTGNL